MTVRVLLGKLLDKFKICDIILILVRPPTSINNQSVVSPLANKRLGLKGID